MLKMTCRLGAVAILLAGLGGCFQASLNGPVVDATITIVALDAPGDILFSATTSDVDSIPADEWNELKSLGRLANIGRIEVVGQFNANEFYLVTASRGRDADADLNREPDEQARPVAGQWHALMTGKQLGQSGRNVSALTEALYQGVLDDLFNLNRKQLGKRLNELSRTLLTRDLTGDGKITYEDALRWSRLLPNSGLTADQGDLDRLALAIQEGEGAKSIATLANRFLAGPAAFGLDDAGLVTTVKRDPDGSCAGRGAAIVSVGLESVTTLPPTDACGEKDRGEVVSSAGGAVGEISPTRDGLPQDVGVEDTSVRIDYETNTQIRLDYVLRPGDTPRSSARNDPSPEKRERITNTYNRLVAASEAGASSSVTKGSAVSRNTSDAFTDTLADAVSYGALASNWAACAVHGLLTELEAQGEGVPEAVSTWAIAGCTSGLSEVETWVEEAPAKDVEKFEETVPAVSLEGCADCYSLIVIPLPGIPAKVGQSIDFNAVAPDNAQDVRWNFGDGNSQGSRSAQYTYQTQGVFTATFNVVYVDGSTSSTQVVIDVGPDDPVGSIFPKAYSFVSDGVLKLTALYGNRGSVSCSNAIASSILVNEDRSGALRGNTRWVDFDASGNPGACETRVTENYQFGPNFDGNNFLPGLLNVKLSDADSSLSFNLLAVPLIFEEEFGEILAEFQFESGSKVTLFPVCEGEACTLP